MELKVTNLRKTFLGSDGEPSFTLDVPEITFAPKKVTFLMGANGSGKSVFLRLLAGDLMPDRDAVILTQNSKRWEAHDKWTAIVRQRAEDNLALDLTVRENLAVRESNLPFFQRFVPLKRDGRFDGLFLQHPNLFRKLDQPCRNLSGGQKQTLAFIAAALHNYALLALDEFLAATDQTTSVALRKMARYYALAGPAVVLIVSHDVQMALEDGDRVIVLQQGKVTADFLRNSPRWCRTELEGLLSS
jgi:putative tryptophan/tyrosine transport system ATP-binding protein